MDKKKWRFETHFYGKDLHREFVETCTTQPMTRHDFEKTLKKRIEYNKAQHKNGFIGVIVTTRSYYVKGGGNG